MPQIFIANKHRHTEIEYPLNSIVTYIGRPFLLGNPFKIGKDGDRKEVIAKFEALTLSTIKMSRHPMRAAILTLTREFWENDMNIVLECWCSPLPCHGDIIKKLILEKTLL